MEELGDFFEPTNGGAGGGSSASGSASGELAGASSHYLPYSDNDNPYARGTGSNNNNLHSTAHEESRAPLAYGGAEDDMDYAAFTQQFSVNKSRARAPSNSAPTGGYGGGYGGSNIASSGFDD